MAILKFSQPIVDRVGKAIWGVSVDLPPSGKSGLMLGEILGLSAGLTSVELVLFLFLFIRPLLESAFLPPLIAKLGLVGEVRALSVGLGFPESAALADGVLNGPSFGVLRAGMRGVF